MPDQLLVVLRFSMQKDRSASRVVQSELNIKQWQQQPPTVSEVRPGCCPSCKAISCPLGGAVQLHGHGLRERQVRGPETAEGAPGLVTLLVRRYRCVPCGAVAIVVPSEVQGRRMYSSSAIGLALALWGLLLATAVVVRQRVCPATILGNDAACGWATLRRWARDVALGKLFAASPKPASSASLREVAASAAAALAASANASTRALPIEQRAFLGAAHAA